MHDALRVRGLEALGNLARDEERFFGRGPEDLIPGSYKAIANKSNDYFIDREMQRTVNFTGRFRPTVKVAPTGSNHS